MQLFETDLSLRVNCLLQLRWASTTLMHQALCILVLQNIFAHLDPWYSSGSLTALASTCKTFHEPAMYLLWADMGGIVHLLGCVMRLYPRIYSGRKVSTSHASIYYGWFIAHQLASRCSTSVLEVSNHCPHTKRDNFCITPSMCTHCEYQSMKEVQCSHSHNPPHRDLRIPETVVAILDA